MERGRQANRARLVGGGIAVAVVAFAVAVAVGVSGSDAPPPPELAAVETFPDLGTEHVSPGEPIAYNSDPPTSGPHFDTTPPCGIHRQPVPDGAVLHSMEHGAVVLHYDPELPEDAIVEMEEIARRLRGELIVVPRPGIEAPVVLTAWRQLLSLESVSEDVVAAFLREHGNRSPEAGALCSFTVEESA